MNSKKIFIIVTCFLGLTGLLFFGLIFLGRFLSYSSNKVMVFNLSEVHSDNFPTALADNEFARLVSEKTNGRIKIDVYTEGKLYRDESDALDALKSGKLDFARISCAPVSYLVPKVNAIILPYLYRDKNHQMKVLSGEIGKSIFDSIKEDIGLTGLCFYYSGARSFYFRDEIKTLEDFSGKKIRIQTTPTMMKLCSLYNATGITGISASEIYNKILNGIVDGAENNILTYESMGDYLSAPFYLKTEHIRIPEILLASNSVMKKLSEADIKILKECAEQTQEFQMRKWVEKETESLKIINKTSKIIEITEDEREIFKEKVNPIYREYELKYADIIQTIKDTK